MKGLAEPVHVVTETVMVDGRVTYSLYDAMDQAGEEAQIHDAARKFDGQGARRSFSRPMEWRAPASLFERRTAGAEMAVHATASVAMNAARITFIIFIPRSPRDSP
mgnify:CR=1 FL=1